MLQGKASTALAMGDAALAWLCLLPILLDACTAASVLEPAITAMYQVRVAAGLGGQSLLLV